MLPSSSQDSQGVAHTWKFYSLIIALLIVIGIGVYFGIRYAPRFLGSIGGSVSEKYDEYDDGVERIPYDTKVLSISMSDAVDTGSLTSETVTLTPHIDGQISASSDKKTISYTLSKELEIGESYELRVASTARKSDTTPLGKDAFVNFIATSGAKAVRIFPTGLLDTLSQNITVVFNTPMVALTNLDERDKLPCPLVITPKIEGKCVWTNTSILEYIPTVGLEGSTRYTLEIRDTPGLLHTLKETLTGEILTTPLQVRFDDTFSPVDGIRISTNFPVSLESLMSAIDIAHEGDSSSGGRLTPLLTPEKNEDGTISETKYTLMLKDGSYTYSTGYTLSIRSTLNPKYGTEPLREEVTRSVRTTDFVTGIEVYQNILDNSGTLSDTKNYGSINQGMFPSERLFFLAHFDQDMPLDRSLISLRAEKDGSTTDFDIVYGKVNEYDVKGEIIKTKDDPRTLKITPKSSLKKDTQYELVFQKKSSAAMTNDEVGSFHTAQEFRVSDFKLISNTEACIYTNNTIPYSYNSDDGSLPQVVTSPVSRKPTLRSDEGQYVWSDDGRTSTLKYTCPVIAGKKAYVVDLRLNPLLSYTIDFLPTLRDEYGQGLSKKNTFSFKTGPIASKDRYLYSSAEGSETEVIPSSLPIVLGLLSVNTDSTNIEVCEMDQAGYIAYLEQRRNSYDATPNCVKKATKKITLKNRFWTTTPTQVDLEKEILESSFTTPYVWIHGYIDGYDRNSSQSFYHIYQRANLSLTLEDGKNSRILFASSYDGKTIPSDLTFESYRWNYENNTFIKTPKPPITFNTSKKLYTITDPDFQLDLLIAKNRDYFAMLNLGSDETSNYDFKYISGQDASNRDYLYIYPDRPLYKPSDTVYFKGILRSFRFDGYRASEYKKGKVKIIGGQGTVSGEVTIAEMDVILDENSNIHGEFSLPKSAPLGRYTFEFQALDAQGNPIFVYNNGEFYIEAYKKPVFKVTTEVPKSDALIGDSVDIAGHAEYYFGGALARAQYQYSVLAQNYYFNPRDYSSYHFSVGSAYMDCLYWGSCDYNDVMKTSGTGILDDKGNTTIHHEYEKGSTQGEQIYTYSLEVTDPDTQKTVNHAVSQIVHATDAYVGIMAPYWNSGKNGVKLDGIVLSHSAEMIAGRTVGLELIKREWKNVKKQGVDGVFYNEGAIEETKIDTASITSDAKGEFSHTFLSATGGEYEIRATYTGSNNVAFISSVYTYVSGDDEEYYWYEGNNAIADMTADKTILAVGDRAGFTLKTPIQSGKMLVTIEKDDGILDSFVSDITGTTLRIEFPMLDTYIPNVYVKVFALGQNPGENLPVYKRALSVVKVLPDPKKLSVTVSAEKKQYLPGEPVKIQISVKDASGKAVAGANGSLSVVDESLLALAGNPVKNPFAFFYDMKRYLGVTTYVSLLHLVQKLEVKDTSLGEKGGAGEGQKGGLSKKKRGVFKDTAYWQADFTTDKNGTYALTTPALPDNLTTWVIEALVSTKKSEVGVSTTHIQTSKNVLINDNLPRFLGTSDVVEIAPVVFNKTEKDSTFDITVEASNVTLKDSKKSVEIKAGAQVGVPFEITVHSREQIRHVSPQAAKITIKAVSRVTGDLDIIEMTLPIVETTTREMVVTSGRVETSGDEKIEISSSLRQNGGSLDIHYAATLLPGLLSGLEFLSSYPYGCIEQQLAAIMPQVYLKALYESLGLPYDLTTKMVSKYISKEEGYQDVSIATTIDEIIAGIASFQRYDGGFGYWTNSTYSDLSLTLSVVSRLRELQKIGFVPPTEVFAQASKYIKDIFYTNIRPYCIGSDCRYSLTERFAMITGLLNATPDEYEAYKMYQVLLAEMKKDDADRALQSDNRLVRGVDFSLGHARLLLRLTGLSGVSDDEKKSLLAQAKALITKITNDNIVVNPRGAFIGRSEAYSRLSNTLAYVEVVTLYGRDVLDDHQTLIDDMSRWIMSQKKSDGSFGSTLDTTSVIRSITAIERSTGNIRNTQMDTALTLDGKLIKKKTIDAKNKLETFSTGFALSTLLDSSLVHFDKTGTGRIYYDIALEYAIPAKDIHARDEGFFIESAYYDYEEYQAIERAKKEEWDRYIQGDIEYKDLKYPKDTIAYLKTIESPEIGKLVFVSNRMILAEPRDQVAFEGFIPAGAELINPNLKTESQDVMNGGDSQTSLFDHEEWRDDRYFATVSKLDAGIYTFHYIFRPTHAGVYDLLPSRVSEFYHPEVFGRNAGKSVRIE